MTKYFVAGDASGYSMYEVTKDHLQENYADRIEVVDCKNWPKFWQCAFEVGRQVEAAAQRGEAVRGIVTCGSGLGTCMVANKFPHVRAACATTADTARHARSVFDCNVITLGGRATTGDEAHSIIDAFVATDFADGWVDSIKLALRQTVEEMEGLAFTANAPPLKHPGEDEEEQGTGAASLGPSPS